MTRRIRRFRLPATADKGFTLLEVLVALVLISFLLVMLYGSLYAGARNWSAGEVRARENDDKRLVLSFIRQVTGETMPIFRVDGQDARVMFRGDNSSLQFVSRLPAHHAGSGIYLLKLIAEDDDLLLKYTPLNRDKAMFDEDVFVEAERISLLENIQTINLDYFGRDTPNAEPAWHDDWNNEAHVPELVRLIINAYEADSWPPLVIAVRAHALPGLPQLTLRPEEEDVSG